MDGISTTLGCLSRSSIAFVSHLIDRSLFTPLVAAGAFKGRWNFYCSTHSTVDGGRCPPYKCTKSSLEGSSKSNLHARIVVVSQTPSAIAGSKIQRRAYVKTDSHLIMMKKRPGEVGFSVSRTVCRTKFYRTREINRGSIQRIELQAAADKRCKLRRPIRVLHEIGVRIPITRNARGGMQTRLRFLSSGGPTELLRLC